MSDEAERLREVLRDVTEMRFGQADDEAQGRRDTVEIVQTIVTELGITEEMVDDIRCLHPSSRQPRCVNCERASSALSTLLEVSRG